tara:strand:+ start:127 stop:321 length:195 start_codon:yes stop_codon:yes gene_type:complete
MFFYLLFADAGGVAAGGGVAADIVKMQSQKYDSFGGYCKNKSTYLVSYSCILRLGNNLINFFNF